MFPFAAVIAANGAAYRRRADEARRAQRRQAEAKEEAARTREWAAFLSAATMTAPQRQVVEAIAVLAPPRSATEMPGDVIELAWEPGGYALFLEVDRGGVGTLYDRWGQMVPVESIEDLRRRLRGDL